MNIVMNRRRFGTLLVASGAASVFPTFGGALALEAGQVAHRINKADRMSMLAERVAKAVALIRLDVNREEDLHQLQVAHDEFDDILLGFATGEGESGVTKERVVNIKKKLETVEKYWSKMRIAVEEIIASGTVDDEHFEFVESHDVELEVASHDVVKALEEQYSGVDIELGLALAIDLAGRQRMLTQKMTKDVAFAAMDYHVEESHEDFAKNVKKFGKIIDVLITGGGGVVQIGLPPTQSAVDALNAVKAHWDTMAPLIAEVDATEKPSREQVAKFAEESELLLEESNKVTDLYESFVAGVA